ncbi:Trypsin [Popillia japonica]|uniref:Trypsin n=1 Tax=Popillia japonica TaxID=7064 RepID=A0AAW1HX97_POPJA
MDIRKLILVVILIIYKYRSNADHITYKGAYIDIYWILTAAHCLLISNEMDVGDHNRVTAYMGVVNYRIRTWERQERKSVKLIVHPEYNTATIENRTLYDIGMIKLDRAFVDSNSVKVGRIPPIFPKRHYFTALSYYFKEAEPANCGTNLTLIICKHFNFETIDGAPMYADGNKTVVGIVSGNLVSELNIVKPGDSNWNNAEHLGWSKFLTTDDTIDKSVQTQSPN